MPIKYKPIGTIRSPWKKGDKVPIQPPAAKGIKGTVVLENKYQAGLKDLNGFSHIILTYHFHASKGYDLEVVPFLDDIPHGVFSTRAPKRPNAIGISVVKLIAVRENILEIENVDMLDNTPLLDIKPYIPDFDIYQVDKYGWQEGKSRKIFEKRSDERFT